MDHPQQPAVLDRGRGYPVIDALLDQSGTATVRTRFPFACQIRQHPSARPQLEGLDLDGRVIPSKKAAD